VRAVNSPMAVDVVAPRLTEAVNEPLEVEDVDASDPGAVELPVLEVGTGF
jgi:hypothetical protein